MTLPTIPESVYDHAMDTYLASPRGIRGSFLAALDSVWPDLYALAVASLPAAPPWKPIEPGTVIKAGTRYRRICVAERVAAGDFAAGEDYNYSIDPRTVPVDPDADLVEAMARAARAAHARYFELRGWGDLRDPERDALLADSRVQLAAIRETHTVEPKPAAGPLGGAR